MKVKTSSQLHNLKMIMLLQYILSLHHLIGTILLKLSCLDMSLLLVFMYHIGVDPSLLVLFVYHVGLAPNAPVVQCTVRFK